MSTLSLRIRRARTRASLSQAELARRIGVKRSAVTQWESPVGTLPSMEHLIGIAIHTGANFEWIATGRGGSACSPEAELAVMVGDYAMDELESRALMLLRNLPMLRKGIAVRLLGALAQ